MFTSLSEKGVLDLSEIRSSRMKQRLIANLHSGDEDEEATGSLNNEAVKSQQQSPPHQPPTRPPPLYQQPIAPMVLPPINPQMLNRTLSPSVQRKEVRFAPSPILVSDDEELTMLLEKRRQDVESRAKIVENNPTPEVGAPAQQQSQQQQPYQTNARMNGHVANEGVDEEQHQQQYTNQELVKSAAEAVQSARKIFAPLPLPPPELDANNNEIEGQQQLEQQQQPVNIFKQVYQMEQSPLMNHFQQIPSPTPVPTCQSPKLLGIEDESKSVTELMDRIDDDMQRMRVTQQHQQEVSQLQGYRSVAPPSPPSSSSSQAVLDNNLNKQHRAAPPTPTPTYMNQPHTSYQPVTPSSPQPTNSQEYFAASAVAHQPLQNSEEHFTATFHPQQDRHEYSAHQSQPAATTRTPDRALPQFRQISSQENKHLFSEPPVVSMAYQVHPQQRAPPSKSSEILSDLLEGLQGVCQYF